MYKVRALIDIPLIVGAPVVVTAVLAAHVMATPGAIATLVTECTIEVERVDNAPEETNTVWKKIKGKEEKQ